MSNESTVLSLLNSASLDDPQLYQCLALFIQDYYTLQNQINPPTGAASTGITGQLTVPSTVTNFVATIFPTNLRLTWDQIFGATYEVRYISGSHNASSWNVATSILKTATTTADLDPLSIPLTIGAHTFLIRSVAFDGTQSAGISFVVVNIPAISAPTVSPTVVGNFVLLYWTTPTSSLDIAYYNVYKNAVLQGKMNGTFEAIFETAGGTFSYTVQAVDIVGNVGSTSPAAVVAVGNPQDFTLQATLTSTFSGTKTNCFTEMVSGQKYLISCVDTGKTWATHFSTPVWANIDAQIAAGYPIYAEPSLTTASYVEVFDFGSIINNIITVVTFNTLLVAGSVAFNTSTIETSTDNITYSAPTTGFTLFAASVRYVRVTLNFVGASDKSLLYIYNLQCLLNVHREMDGGTVSVFAADVGGTVVSFNKAFKSIDSITLAPVSTVFRSAIYDFAFPVNPTTFKILLYDAAGVRKDGTVSWTARGIF